MAQPSGEVSQTPQQVTVFIITMIRSRPFMVGLVFIRDPRRFSAWLLAAMLTL